MKLDVDGPGGRRQAFAYTGGKRFDASLPAIVFIHGAMHDHSSWTLLARWFAHHGHAVLAPDLPGHSQSTGAPLESVEAIADWLLALLDAAGVDEAALVGHSMGSLIALEAAARAPARVESPGHGRHGLSDGGVAGAARGRRKGSVRRDRQCQCPVDLDPGRQALLSRPRHVAARRRPHPGAPAADGATRGQPVRHRFPGLRSLSRRPRGGGARRLPDDAGARRARPDDLAEERFRACRCAAGAGRHLADGARAHGRSPGCAAGGGARRGRRRSPKQPPASARPARRARARRRG